MAPRHAGAEKEGAVADPKDEGGLVQMVSPLQSVNEQIGGHVLGALQRPNTVAVLSTILPGLGPDRVVSVPLSPAQFQAVQALLAQIAEVTPAAGPARKTIGFSRGDEE